MNLGIPMEFWRDNRSIEQRAAEMVAKLEYAVATSPEERAIAANRVAAFEEAGPADQPDRLPRLVPRVIPFNYVPPQKANGEAGDAANGAQSNDDKTAALAHELSYWKKMAENTQLSLVESIQENKKLRVTIDFLARENVRYQQIIEEHQTQGVFNIVVPALVEFNDGDIIEEIYEGPAKANNDNSMSL